jgi:hypothetical protein
MRRVGTACVAVAILLIGGGPARAQVHRPDCPGSETRLQVHDHYGREELLTGEMSERDAMAAFVETLNVTPEIKAAFDPAQFEERARGEHGARYERSRDGRTVAAVALERTALQRWRVTDAVACGELWMGGREAPPGQPRGAIGIAAAAGLASALLLLRRTGRLRGLVVSGALSTVVLALPLTGAALAHCADSNSCNNEYDWYHSEWQADHHTGLDIKWRFTTPFPDGAKRDRVIDAFQKWNGLGQKMKFGRLSDVNEFTIDCDGDPGSAYHGIFWRNIDALARTMQCDHARWDGSKGSTLHEFHITFDSDRSWHGYLTDPPGNEYDFYSVAVHEVGHATGFYGAYADGHFDPGGDLCGTDAEQTLCPYVSMGESHWRSLEEHDKHTFDNAYPNL